MTQKAASLLVFVTATTRRRDVMCASHTFTSFYVTHLAQPNNSSRRRVVAVTKHLAAAKSKNRSLDCISSGAKISDHFS